MTPENFAYWLNGFVELTQGQTPCPAQWKAIKEHLDLVFKKVTPPVAETKIKVDVDTKGAQKAVEDLAKSYEEAIKRVKDANPYPSWYPSVQPYWLGQDTGFLPGTIIC